jgi:hypothetical protein
MRQCGPYRSNGSHQNVPKRIGPYVVGGTFEGHVAGETRCDRNAIEPTEGGDSLASETISLVVGGHVSGERNRTAAKSLSGSRGPLGATTDDSDTGAVADQTLRGGKTHTCGASDHEVPAIGDV